MANRIFSKPRPKELLTRDQSSGGSYRLSSAEDLIAYHRKLKRGNPWPSRIHHLLTAGLFLAFFTVLFGVWLALTCEGSGEAKDASECFTVAVWACLAGACLVLAKCYWNSRYPQD